MNYIDACLSWNNVTAVYLIIFILIIVIANLYLFISLTYYTNYSVSNIIDGTCIVRCDHQICKYLTSNLRDKNYLINTNLQPTRCIFTTWELLHVLLHMFVGYFFNIYIAIVFSILFELYEHYVYNCGSILDLFWNTSGLFIGIYIRYILT